MTVRQISVNYLTQYLKGKCREATTSLQNCTVNKSGIYFRRINRRIARHEVEKNIIQEVILNRDESILFTVPGHYRAQLSRSGYFDTQYKVRTHFRAFSVSDDLISKL